MKPLSRLERIEHLLTHAADASQQSALADLREWQRTTWTADELESLERCAVHALVAPDRRPEILRRLGKTAADIDAMLADVPAPTPADIAAVDAALLRATPAQKARWQRGLWASLGQ